MVRESSLLSYWLAESSKLVTLPNAFLPSICPSHRLKFVLKWNDSSFFHQWLHRLQLWGHSPVFSSSLQSHLGYFCEGDRFSQVSLLRGQRRQDSLLYDTAYSKNDGHSFEHYCVLLCAAPWGQAFPPSPWAEKWGLTSAPCKISIWLMLSFVRPRDAQSSVCPWCCRSCVQRQR